MDPLEDLAAYHDLRQKCVSAKISLTRRPKVNLFYDYKGKIMRLQVTRETFEDLTGGLMRRCQLLTDEALEEANLQREDIDTVLLAGGSTRMPMVRAMLKSRFERAPATDINPDECVALGAALTAALESARLSGEKSDIDIRTHDVTSHSLGMVVFRQGADNALHNSRIISKNTRIPCEQTRDEYVTTHDGQTTMDLWLVQGENEDPLECNVLGRFEFYGVPSRPAGESRLAVTYRYNANGIVEVEAMDLRSGQTLAHRLAAGHVTLEDLSKNRIPMQIVLIMDCSGSMYGQSVDDAKVAAHAFVKRSLQPGRQIALVAFPGGVMAPPTSDPRRLSQAIDALTPIGSTPMAAGLKNARDLLRPRAGVQRVFVIMTDGHPDNPEDVSAEVHRIRSSGGRIVTVGVGPQVQQTYLQSLASSKSDVHFCSDSVELQGTFINLATELAQS